MEDLESLSLRLVEYPPGFELLMEDLENLGLRPAEYPHTSTPRIGTSQGGLRKFMCVWRLAAVSPMDNI